MRTLRHVCGGVASSATYSRCGRYRYALTRSWAPAEPRALFVMLNPSTASEIRNDPTVERCERRARAAGFGAFRVVNLFALRSGDPRALRTAADPVGPGNEGTLRASLAWADSVVCAWGVHGAHRGRGAEVEKLLRAGGRPLLHLGLTAGGHPRHPLYVGYGKGFEPWL